MTVKVNFIKDAQNNGRNYFVTDIPSFKIRPKPPKDMEKRVKHIKISKYLQKGSLTAMVVFLKRQEN